MLENAKEFCGFVAGGAEGNRTPDLCSAIARHARVLADFSLRLQGTGWKPIGNAARTSHGFTAELPHAIRPATMVEHRAGLSMNAKELRYAY